jgi:hypothetical protein
MAGKHTQGRMMPFVGDGYCYLSVRKAGSINPGERYRICGIGTGRTPDEEDWANAALIAEAFNVAHETGLTPAQLAEQRRELAEALKSVTSAFATEPDAGVGEDQP